VRDGHDPKASHGPAGPELAQGNQGGVDELFGEQVEDPVEIGNGA
jgi:hypothetical protein